MPTEAEINAEAAALPDPLRRSPVAVEQVQAGAIREGDWVWLDIPKEFKPVVAIKQAGYSEIDFYLDEGPDDEALQTRWLRGETVLRVLPPVPSIEGLQGALRGILDQRDTEWATDPGDMDQRFVANHYAGKLSRIFALADAALSQARYPSPLSQRTRDAVGAANPEQEGEE